MEKFFANNHFKNVKTFFTVILILFSALFISCDKLLPLPNANHNSGATQPDSSGSKVVGTPLNVTASHGQKQQITISWTQVSGAAYYFIYNAKSPHDEFIQIDETDSSASNIVLKFAPGYSGYFKVQAVNALGEKSDLSFSVYGTTLATPIITGIDEENFVTTLYWYMENMSNKTYLSNIQFLATCYNSAGNEVQQKIISGTEETYCTFENLADGEKYSYEVEAYLLNDQSTTEKSMRVDKATQVSTIPKAPEFTVSEGTVTDRIFLNIKLPPLTKYLVRKGTSGDADEYEVRPVFFKIDRYNDSKKEWENVVDYLNFLGTKEQLPAADTPEYNQLIESYKEGEFVPSENGGCFVNYTDSANSDSIIDNNPISRGVKYKYRVLSYTDCCYQTVNGQLVKVNNITHGPAKAAVKEGWAANQANISTTEVSNEYSPKEDGSTTYISSAKFDLRVSWDDLGKANDYYYALLVNRKKFTKDNGDEKDETGTYSFVKNGESNYFESIDQINSLSYVFEFDEDENHENNVATRGNYNYKFFVFPKEWLETHSDLFSNPSSFEDLLSFIEENKTPYVTDVSSKLISNLEIPRPKLELKDGYVSKTIINFTMEQNASYKIVRKEIDAEGNAIQDEQVSIELGSLTELKDCVTVVSANYATFIDSEIESGKAYQYTLLASTSAFADVPSETLKAFTLGTPKIAFDTNALDYDTITVKWDTVLHENQLNKFMQDEKDVNNVVYTITHNGINYEFAQNEFSTKGIVEKEDDEGNYKLTVTNGKEFSLVLKKGIAGFNYDSPRTAIEASNAGKDYDLTIKVTNDVTDEDADNFTEDTVQVHTLGPALLELESTQMNSAKQIKVNWKKIENVPFYVVQRIRPKMEGEDDDKIDVLCVSADGRKITYNGEEVSTERTSAKLGEDGIFTLTDNDLAPTNMDSSYERNQAMIAWGLPFKYCVFPVKSTEDNPFEDFKIEYSKVDEVSKEGCTYGFGINVKASKAEFADKIHLEWDAPNKESLKNRSPVIWYKYAKDDWNRLPPKDKGETHHDFIIPNRRADKLEFAVTYEFTSTANLTDYYVDYNRSKTDDDGEANNLGYAFNLPDTSFEFLKPETESFAESLMWTLYNGDERKKQPGDFMTEADGDCYEIQVKNLNVSQNWQTIATISKDGEVTTFAKGKEGNKAWYDIKLEEEHSNTGGRIIVTPLVNGAEFATTKRLTRASGQADAITGTHNGLLKVQRDYKHYYRLVAKRKNSQEGDIIETYLGDIDNTNKNDTAQANAVYAYRKISDDEFVKGITLIVADAVYQQGVNSVGNGADNYAISGAEGRFVSYHQGGTKYYTYGTFGNDYRHLFRGKAPGTNSEFASGWVLKMNNASDTGASDGAKVYHFAWGGIEVKHETNLDSYQGFVFLRAGKKGNLVSVSKGYDLAIQYSHTDTEPDASKKITIMTAYPNDTNYIDNRDNTYAADGNQNMFQSWFPMQLAVDINSTQSFDSNLPIYSGSWWEERD